MPATKPKPAKKPKKRLFDRVYYTWEDGSKHNRQVRANSRSELRLKIERVKEEMKQEEQDTKKQKIIGYSSNFKDFATSWYERERRRSLAPSSQRQYITGFKNHLFPHFGEMLVRDITRPVIQDYLNTLPTTMAANTAKKILLALKEVMTYAVDEEIADARVLTTWPRLNMPKLKKQTDRRELTPTENITAAWVGYNHEEGFFLLVLYHLGLRKGEALGLKWGDFNLDKKYVCIQRDIDSHVGKDDGHLDDELVKAARIKMKEIMLDRVGDVKTEAGDMRLVPIFDPDFMQELYKRQGGDDEFLFVGKKSGEPLSEQSYQFMWTRLMLAMAERDPSIEKLSADDIKAEKGKSRRKPGMSVLTAHNFRHNFATCLYWADIKELQAAAWMGHSDISMITKVYAHLSKLDSGREVQKLAEYMKQKVAQNTENGVISIVGATNNATKALLADGDGNNKTPGMS